MHIILNKKAITLSLVACLIFTSTQTCEQDNKGKSSKFNSLLAGLNHGVYSANNYIAGGLIGVVQGVVDGAIDAKYENGTNFRSAAHCVSWYATGQIIQKIQPRKIVYTVNSGSDNRSFSWKMTTSKKLEPNPAHGEMLVGRWTTQTILSCVNFGQMKLDWPKFDLATGVSMALQAYDYIAWKYAGNKAVEEKVVITNNKA